MNSPPIVEPILVGHWNVYWAYGILTHGHGIFPRAESPEAFDLTDVKVSQTANTGGVGAWCVHCCSQGVTWEIG